MAHFVAAARQRNPGVEVVQAAAESLPFPDGGFNATLAQLVVHFMTDPVAGISEMARVTRAGGVVAACVWDYAGDRSPLSPLWRVARAMDSTVDDEANLAGAREGALMQLFHEAGLKGVRETALVASVEHATFEEWWEPYTGGVGPAGRYVAGLATQQRNELRDRCRSELSDGPFVLTFQAWAARGQPGQRRLRSSA
jgi:SAM-dependent methyltransferase